MDYIIPESKLNGAIYEYLMDVFDIKNLRKAPYIDESGETYDSSFDFLDEDGDTIFLWSSPEFFKNFAMISKDRRDKLIKQSPVVELTDTDIKQKLNSIFGDLWRPVLKQIFEKEFGLEVKSFYS